MEEANVPQHTNKRGPYEGTVESDETLRKKTPMRMWTIKLMNAIPWETLTGLLFLLFVNHIAIYCPFHSEEHTYVVTYI